MINNKKKKYKPKRDVTMGTDDGDAKTLTLEQKKEVC